MLKYLSSVKAIVALSTEPIEMLVEHGKNGLLYGLGNSDSFAGKFYARSVIQC